MRRPLVLAAILALGLAPLLIGCGESSSAALPAPQEPTRDATGVFCGMTILDHPGPKGQIFLAGRGDPLWFSSARDTIAYTLLPEESKEIAAIYVSDMDGASWDSPEPGRWVEARKAWYVLNSRRSGGMGAAEAVPFARQAAALEFTSRYGGRVVAFDGIPASYILGDGGSPDAARDPSLASSSAAHHHH